MSGKWYDILIYDPGDPMYFTSMLFWLIFGMALLIYSLFYRTAVHRNAYLLLVSLFFYYKAGGLFFIMLIISTLADYFIGLAIHRQQRQLNKKLFLSLSIVINLGILFYFKYAYFLADLVGQLFGIEAQVTNVLALGWNKLTGSGFNVNQIILPVGISFYTFQTISYAVDVYRGKVEPVRKLVDFGFYVSFFPQLVAGPIVRAAAFIPQLYQKYELTKRQVWHAVFLILGGLIKKMVVADFLAIQLVDRVFESPGLYAGIENLLAAYAYAIQIFFDFSGYTDIAIGVALLMGFKLPINFNSPYQSVSISDFWRRWHISLSSWLRDYLYIPLGGNQKGKIRTQINVFITMLLGGLWHGAHWRFVFWGAYHGLLLVIGKLLPNRFANTWPRWLNRFLIFNLVTLGWVFFRAPNFDTALLLFGRIFNNFGGIDVISFIAAYKLALLLLLMSVVFISMPVRWIETFRGYYISRPYWMKIISILLVLFLIFIFQSTELVPFIYFQF